MFLQLSTTPRTSGTTPTNVLDIKQFDGTSQSPTAEDWLREVELAQQINRWSPECTLRIVGYKLEGSASNWWLKEAKTTTTWDGFKETFRKKFIGIKITTSEIKRRKINEDCITLPFNKSNLHQFEDIKRNIISRIRSHKVYNILSSRQHNTLLGELLRDIKECIELIDMRMQFKQESKSTDAEVLLQSTSSTRGEVKKIKYEKLVGEKTSFTQKNGSLQTRATSEDSVMISSSSKCGKQRNPLHSVEYLNLCMRGIFQKKKIEDDSTILVEDSGAKPNLTKKFGLEAQIVPEGGLILNPKTLEAPPEKPENLTSVTLDPRCTYCLSSTSRKEEFGESPPKTAINIPSNLQTSGNGQENKKKSGLYRALPQVLAVTVKNVLLIVFGLTLGFPTILIPGLSGLDPNEPFILGPDGISWIGSINLISVPVGCLISGPITQPLGRKKAMQLVNIPFLAAWLTLRFSSEIWHIFFALALTGLTGGLLEAPVLTYVAEITQPQLRGMLSATSTMAIIVGILAQFLMGTFLPWRTAALANCFLPALAFILLFFIPESPHWLISKNRELDARKSLAWLRGWTTLAEIEPEFKELQRAISKKEVAGIDNPAFEDKDKVTDKCPKNSKSNILKGFTKRTFIRPYCLIIFIFFLGHFSGMTTLQTYAVQIFATLRTPIDKYYATVLLGAVELIGCIICVTSMRFAGKRVLNFISMIGSGICFAIAATYAFSNDIKYLYMPSSNLTNSTSMPNATNVDTPLAFNDSYSWLPMTCLVGSALLLHVCNRTLPWILIGELYPNDIRSVASGLSGAMGYVFGFFANKVFLSMVKAFTLPGTFWFYSSVSFIGSLVLYFVLPETEGKPLYEITDHFEGRCNLGNKVRRKKRKETPCELGNVNPAFMENGDVIKNAKKSENSDLESKL